MHFISLNKISFIVHTVFFCLEGKVSLESVKYKGYYLGVKPDGSGSNTHSLFIPYLVSGKDQEAKGERSERENVIEWER